MEKKTYKVYYTTSDFRYNGDDYYLSKDGLVELIASSEGELREKIKVFNKNIKELEKSLEYHLGFKMIIEKKLSNDKFVNNAPENVIQNERKKLEDVVEKIRLIKEALKNHTN